MSTWRLDIAYEGTRFRGWARQRDHELPTVQGEIEDALEQLFGEPVPLTVAGRTDAGVHATGQVASLVTPAGKEPPPTFLEALNSLTSEDVAITSVAAAADDFDARRDARSRRYRYRVDTNRVQSPFERRFAARARYPLEVPPLHEAARAIPGKHDFTAFTPTDNDHVFFDRTVKEARWEEAGEGILHFEIEADAFMRNMVRILVGTMLEIGSGRRPVESMASLIEGRPRPEAGETAPAHGLFLIGVRY